jgi:putative Holliday junction resolvase
VRIIGLDLGTKSLGIAITDSMQILASGVDNFLFPEHKYELAINRLEKVIAEYGDVSEIILGYPISVNNKQTEMSIRAKNFLKLLKKKFNNLEIKL